MTAPLNTDLNSPSFIIRRGILDRLKQVPTFQNVKRWALTPALRVQAKVEDNQLPYVGCYHVDESLGPDGDANHTEPRFSHTAVLGFTVIIASVDDDVADQNLDSAFWTILNLLTNPRWSKFPAGGAWNKGEPIRIEGVTRGSHKKIFGNRATNNETPVAELQMTLTVTFRTGFDPSPLDDLNRIHVTVAYPWPYDPNLEEAFIVEYDLPVQGAFTANNYSTLSPDLPKPSLTVS